MSSNKSAKEALIRLYGPECFIDKLKLRKFDKPVHYTSQGQYKKMKMLTYHHIKMKKDGGKATVENGALLSAENHQWFHQQSQRDQNRMNDAFQNYKRIMDYQKCSIELVEDIEKEFEVEMAELVVEDNKIEFKKLNKRDKKRQQRKQRQKEKKEMQRLKKEYEDR